MFLDRGLPGISAEGQDVPGAEREPQSLRNWGCRGQGDQRAGHRGQGKRGQFPDSTTVREGSLSARPQTLTSLRQATLKKRFWRQRGSRRDNRRDAGCHVVAKSA
jgi:hypothetical protein